MSVVSTDEVKRDLASRQLLSQRALNYLSQQARNIEVTRTENAYDDPVFVCFVVDASASMEPYTQEVVSAQPEALAILRDSAKCKKGSMYVAQRLFNHNTTDLHSFRKLAPDSNDAVVRFDAVDCYKPEGNTALYKTVYDLLQLITAQYAVADAEGLEASFTVALLTDGEDNIGGVNPNDIRAVMAELYEKNILRSAVLLGLTNPKFTDTMLAELRDRLGFTAAVPLDQNRQNVRKAFVLASQSAVTPGWQP